MSAAGGARPEKVSSREKGGHPRLHFYKCASASDLTTWMGCPDLRSTCLFLPAADEGTTGVSRLVRDVAAQWRSLSVEVRSVRSMLEEVLSNWDRYVSTVASFQAWLEDAEETLRQPQNTKQVRKKSGATFIRFRVVCCGELPSQHETKSLTRIEDVSFIALP